MKKSIVVFSVLMGIGYTTQAHADYVPKSTAWTQISSTAARSDSEGTMVVSHSGPDLTESRSWTWVGKDNPTAATIQLDFTVSLGQVSLGPNAQGVSSSSAGGGFNSSRSSGNDAYNFSQSNVASRAVPGKNATTLTAHLAKDYPAAQTTFETAYVGAGNFVRCDFGGYANSSTSTLSGFSLIQH